jgi:Spy/CpxP family protein refolding chaperone
MNFNPNAMKTVSLTLSFLFFLTLSGISQPGKGQGRGKDRGAIRERIKSERIAFITERLSLTSEEAQRFWPVYNDLHQQMEAIKKEQRQARKNLGDRLASMPDRDVEIAMNEDLNRQQQLLDLQRKATLDMSKILPPKKVAMLLKAERDFKLELLKKMKDRGMAPPAEDEF